MSDQTMPVNGAGPETPPWHMPGSELPGQPDTTATDLAEVLVNYEEIFGQVHGRYHQLLAQLMQEAAELRAGFNQAVARMKAAEAEIESLRQIVQST